jgi:hypothetical protein
MSIRDHVHRHRALIGYVFIVLMVMFALEGYQRSLHKRLDRRDAISCAQRQKLAETQRFVLQSLTTLSAAAINDTDQQPIYGSGQRQQLGDLLRETTRRSLAEPITCFEGD